MFKVFKVSKLREDHLLIIVAYNKTWNKAQEIMKGADDTDEYTYYVMREY